MRYFKIIILIIILGSGAFSSSKVILPFEQYGNLMRVMTDTHNNYHVLSWARDGFQKVIYYTEYNISGEALMQPEVITADLPSDIFFNVSRQGVAIMCYMDTYSNSLVISKRDIARGVSVDIKTKYASMPHAMTTDENEKLYFFSSHDTRAVIKVFGPDLKLMDQFIIEANEQISSKKPYVTIVDNKLYIFGLFLRPPQEINFIESYLSDRIRGLKIDLGTKTLVLNSSLELTHENTTEIDNFNNGGIVGYVDSNFIYLYLPNSTSNSSLSSKVMIKNTNGYPNNITLRQNEILIGSEIPDKTGKLMYSVGFVEGYLRSSKSKIVMTTPAGQIFHDLEGINTVD